MRVQTLAHLQKQTQPGVVNNHCSCEVGKNHTPLFHVSPWSGSMRRNNPRSPSQWQWQWPQDEGITQGPCFVIGVMSNHDEKNGRSMWCTMVYKMSTVHLRSRFDLDGGFLKPNSRTFVWDGFSHKFCPLKLPTVGCPDSHDLIDSDFTSGIFHLLHQNRPIVQKSHSKAPPTKVAKAKLEEPGRSWIFGNLLLLPPSFPMIISTKSHKFPDHQKAATLSSDCDCHRSQANIAMENHQLFNWEKQLSPPKKRPFLCNSGKQSLIDPVPFIKFRIDNSTYTQFPNFRHASMDTIFQCWLTPTNQPTTSGRSLQDPKLVPLIQQGRSASLGGWISQVYRGWFQGKSGVFAPKNNCCENYQEVVFG